MSALFSANKGEWFTPPEIIRRVHEVMDRIDLDPASCKEANKLIRAEKFYGVEDDGLSQQWVGQVFLNPPGTCPKGYDDYTVCGNKKVCSCNLPQRFWRKLMLEFSRGRVREAIYLGFSLNQLATLQHTINGDRTSPLDFPICILKNRLKFLDPQTGSPVNGPTQHNFVTYMGPREMKFRAVFRPLGAVK